MTDSIRKSQRELSVFQEFIERSDLVVDPDSIDKRSPPEPDILCRVRGEGHVAFELKEICDSNIAKVCSDIQRAKSDESPYLRSGNPVCNLVKKTRNKNYVSEFPIELLMYTDGRVICAPDTMIPAIQRAFDNNRHQFRCVWFMGQSGETCKCVFRVPSRARNRCTCC